MYSYEFEIHELPRMTNPSGRGTHWAVLAKEARKWKELVWLMCTGYKPEKPLEKAKLTLTRISSSEPDFDGLVSGFKRIIDGLVECGVIKNDKMSNIGQSTYRWEKGKPGKGLVRIRIESIE